MFCPPPSPRLPRLALGALLALLLPIAGVRATLLREYWLNLPGAAVSDLTGSPVFPNSPSGSNQLATFEGPLNWADNYGTRIRGYLTPAVSGPYIFWIASDDASELWLSSDGGPDNKALIASVPGATAPREWTKYPSQQSISINLVAGQLYYVEALHKEAFGGDHVSVGWAKPGEATTAPSEIIPGSVISPWTGPRPGYNSRPVITSFPTNRWFAEGPLSLQLTASTQDDGLPLPANPASPNPGDPDKFRWNWTVISQPAASGGVVWSGHATNGEAFTYSGSPNSPGTVFTCDPTVTLDVPGLYIFQFTASDGDKVATNSVKVFVRSSSTHRALGYSYLSPVPGAEYCSPQTRFILVRFQNVTPSALTNLSAFIHVQGAFSGNHPGVAKIAGDSHTVIFQMSADFSPNELVTVSLSPGLAAGGAIAPYQYQFMISGHLPDKSSVSGADTTDPQNGAITARGDNPPNETRFRAFDDTLGSKWLDFAVPEGTNNFSWIQYVYAGAESNAVNRYTIASANDAPERDPTDWNFYGVDNAGILTRLDRRTGESFANRFQVNSYSITNSTAYRGYRLEITRIANPAVSVAVQLSELEFIRGTNSGSLAILPNPAELAPVPGLPALSPVGTAPLGLSAPVNRELPGLVKPRPAPVKTSAGPAPQAYTAPNGVSVPGDFPRLNITTNSNPDKDYIFIDNRGGGGQQYNIIFDNAGNPVWYSRYPDEHRDMKVQPTGVISMLARDVGIHYIILNTNYQQIAAYWSTNGYTGDDHELQILPNGNYYLVAMRAETVDMSRYVPGGNPAASVTEEIFQEFTAAGDLIWQWRAWDHIDVRDQSQFMDLTSAGFDFPHINAIDRDADGNLVISERNTSEIAKIDAETGRIIWVLSGPANQFTFLNDALAGTRNQHAIRALGNNHYTVFDNGNLHNPAASRAVEYLLDPAKFTATIVWQYPPVPDPGMFSFYMGNAQRLTNGNTLINWAITGLPKLTEIRPDGSKAFEMNWANQYESYRTWRCAWQGVALQPYLLLEPYPDSLALIFNQFGDTNIAYYRIYGGPTPHPTRLLATSATTLKSLSNLTNGLYYFRVTAVNNAGVEGPFSNETNLTVNIVKPGQNLAVNGDFSRGTNGWGWNVTGAASAAWQVESGVAHAYLTNGGASFPSAQLQQGGIALFQGRQYILQFDAWSPRPRYIDVRVAQAASPFTDYSHITTPFLTPTRAHYRFAFTMTSASDFSANLLFNLGSSTADVFLDNITLYNPPIGDFNTDTRVDYLDLANFSANWLKQQLNLPADLDGNAQVDFRDFGIFGENWSTGIP